MDKELPFQKIFDALQEGVQVIDFNWRYIYVNRIVATYHTSTVGLLGTTVMERYPGIEHTEFFGLLFKCMTERTSEKTETEFTYPDKSTMWFELNIEPIKQGILILSRNISQTKEAYKKLEKAMHLYALISQLNQNIVRVPDEKLLFRNVCRIATQFGKFKIAWIGRLDSAQETISLVDQSGLDDAFVPLFVNTKYSRNGPQWQVLESGSYYLNNDIEHDPDNKPWRELLTSWGIRSCVILPIRKGGTIIATLNLYADEVNFAQQEEIDLLVEATADISFALDMFEKTRQLTLTQEQLRQNARKFHDTLDNMLEGVQIHDVAWRYLYANDELVKYSHYTREELIGYSLQEKYPGIEDTELFSVLSRCMQERRPEKFETEFVFPDGSKAFFDLSIQPIPEGISILSVDRTEQKIAREKLVKGNRLYAFISAINQSIVHIGNEQELMDNACTIAVAIGQFKMALINRIDKASNTLTMVSLKGNASLVETAMKHSGYPLTDARLQQTPSGKVISTGLYAVSNDVQNDPAMIFWRKELAENEIRSFISLPLKKFGRVVGTVDFFSGIANFFDETEIALLVEAVNDISFALENFAKARRHRKTEELVEKNEARFRALSEKSADMTVLSTIDGKPVYGSPSITKILGYTQEEFLKASAFALVHPEDTLTPADIAELFRATGNSILIQQRMLHKDGAWIWCEGTMTNMLDEPNVQALVSNFRDVSEKKAAEQQREFDSNNLHALINSTQDVMWSVDRDFNLITSNEPFNHAMQELGLTMGKGQNVLAISTSPEQSTRFKQAYERAFSGETFTKLEHNDLPVEYWIEVNYCPIRKGEEVIGAACFSRDITTKKKIERELIHNNEELQKTNTELDRFVYSASHDLRSPLTSVLGLVNLIEIESHEPDTLQYSRMIRDSVNRLDGFIKNILSYSRNNRTEVEASEIHVVKMLTGIVTSLCNMKEAEGITFNINVDEEVPFYSDVHRMSMVCENLISNAIKFHYARRVDKYIRITGKSTSEELTLQVADNGIGIDAEYHEKIFQMFFRLADKMSGSGIGLYIVKETVEKMEGTIMVESTLGTGTTFTLHLKNFVPELMTV